MYQELKDEEVALADLLKELKTMIVEVKKHNEKEERKHDKL